MSVMAVSQEFCPSLNDSETGIMKGTNSAPTLKSARGCVAVRQYAMLSPLC